MKEREVAKVSQVSVLLETFATLSFKFLPGPRATQRPLLKTESTINEVNPVYGRLSLCSGPWAGLQWPFLMTPSVSHSQ